MVFHAGFALFVVAFMLVREGRPVRLWPQRPLLVGLRGLLAGLGTVFTYHAFQRLPQADVYAIAFATPILVVFSSARRCSTM